MDRIEQTILRNLLYNETYTRKVLPYITEDYFAEDSERHIFKSIQEFLGKYNRLPSKEALAIETDTISGLLQTTHDQSLEILQHLEDTKTVRSPDDWLVDQTEKFCQEKALYNALLTSISIAEGKKRV